MKNTKYDEVISIGASCDCRAMIREFNLSEKYYPLDWLAVYDNDEFLDLIENDLKDLFSDVSLDDLKNIDGKNFCIYDKINKVSSIHDVYHNDNLHLSIDQIKNTPEYIEFKDKMIRRTKRWIETLSDGNKNILFIRMELFVISTNEFINNLYSVLKRKHKNMDLHYIYNNTKQEDVDLIINDNIVKVPVNMCGFGECHKDTAYLNYIKTHHNPSYTPKEDHE